MNIRDVVAVALRLIRSKWRRNILVGIALFVGSYLFFIFSALTAGLETLIFEPVREKLQTEVIIARPRSAESPAGFRPLEYLRSFSAGNIPVSTQKKIEALPEVWSVAEEIKIPFPVATRAQLFLGVEFDLDAVVSGFSEEAVEEVLPPEQTFSGREDILPVVVSPLLVEIYNSTLVELIPGLTRKSWDDFLGRELEFTFGRTNYLPLLQGWPPGEDPLVKRARVVGFAPFLSPLTFGVPAGFARTVREMSAPSTAVLPQALLITPRQPEDIPRLKEKLEEAGLSWRDSSQNFATIQNLFSGFKLLLIGSGATVLIVTLLLFGTVTLISSLEYKKSIALFSALGASTKDTGAILFVQSFLPAILALFGGLGAAFLTAVWLERNISAFLPFSSSIPFSVLPVVSSTLGVNFAGIIFVMLFIIFLSIRRVQERLSPASLLE